jgi:hypothetical protein
LASDLGVEQAGAAMRAASMVRARGRFMGAPSEESMGSPAGADRFALETVTGRRGGLSGVGGGGTFRARGGIKVAGKKGGCGHGSA